MRLFLIDFKLKSFFSVLNHRHCYFMIAYPCLSGLTGKEIMPQLTILVNKKVNKYQNVIM